MTCKCLVFWHQWLTIHWYEPKSLGDNIFLYYSLFRCVFLCCKANTKASRVLLAAAGRLLGGGAPAGDCCPRTAPFDVVAGISLSTVRSRSSLRQVSHSRFVVLLHRLDRRSLCCARACDSNKEKLSSNQSHAAVVKL